MSSSSPSVSVRELPLFPLPELVLFPGRPLPLHIFEYRYRMMMNTILDTDRRFGVLMWDPETDSPAKVGCCAEVIQHERLPDDRINIMTLGQQRFRVLEYVREKPYRVGLIEWIEDEPPKNPLEPIAQDVERLLRDVVHLSNKLHGEEMELPEELPPLPRELSYWVAYALRGVAQEQQRLLEVQDTYRRLERELEILTNTRNQLAARTVLRDTLSDSEAETKD